MEAMVAVITCAITMMEDSTAAVTMGMIFWKMEKTAWVRSALLYNIYSA